MSALGILNGNSQHAQLAREYRTTYTPVTLRRHLKIWLDTAERKMKLGLQQPTGDMWTRAYEMAKDMRDQIALLDEVMQ
jgi:hypothetical protein